MARLALAAMLFTHAALAFAAWKSASRALVAIIMLPVGVLMALIAMHWLGLASNIMSLGGIAICSADGRRHDFFDDPDFDCELCDLWASQGIRHYASAAANWSGLIA